MHLHPRPTSAAPCGHPCSSWAEAVRRPAALLLALPLALGTAGIAMIETAAPAAAEQHASAPLQRDAERLDRGALGVVTDDGVFL